MLTYENTDGLVVNTNTDNPHMSHYASISAHDAYMRCKALRDVLLTEAVTARTSPPYDKPGNYITPDPVDKGVRLSFIMVGNDLTSVCAFSLRFNAHKGAIHLYVTHGGHSFLIDTNAYGILTALFGYQLDKRAVLFKLTDGIYLLTKGLGRLPTIFKEDRLVLAVNKDIGQVGPLASLASAHYCLDGKRYLPVREEVTNGKRYTYLRELSDE